MTAKELLEYELYRVGKQLEIVVSGLDESQFDVKDTDFSMSARETLAHLCEAYTAFIAISRGQKYAWGSYQPTDTHRDALLNEWTNLRDAAVEAALTGDGERNKLAYDYMVGHDNYHVGQLAHIRMAAQPDWDSNDLYA